MIGSKELAKTLKWPAKASSLWPVEPDLHMAGVTLLPGIGLKYSI